jgi:hypothetical protein
MRRYYRRRHDSVVNGEFEGEVMSGAQPFEAFQQRLDSLLQQPQK